MKERKGENDKTKKKNFYFLFLTKLNIWTSMYINTNEKPKKY